MLFLSSDEQAREIEKLCEIAKENGAALSIRELAQLTPSSERELEGAFLSDARLRARFQLVSGYVLERSRGGEEEARAILEDERMKRERARANVAVAARFAARLVPGTLLVSLSGSNSYMSAREGDDIDFFCVTKKNWMWTFMLRSLILTRISKFGRSDRVRVCLSCIMDEDWARREFGTRQDPIFARDALMASPIYGRGAYHRLLTRASWIDGYFPAFYKVRLRETADGAGVARVERAGLAAVNLYLFALLGSYMRLKAWALNRRFQRQGKTRSLFSLNMGPDHYLCESNKYKKLRKMYLASGA